MSAEDQRMARRIEEIAADIRCRPNGPRITRSALLFECQAVTRFRKHEGDFPMTTATIDRLAETVEAYGRRRLRSVLKDMKAEGHHDVTLARVVDRYQVPQCLKPGIRDWLKNECETLSLRWLDASSVTRPVVLALKGQSGGSRLPDGRSANQHRDQGQLFG